MKPATTKQRKTTPIISTILLLRSSCAYIASCLFFLIDASVARSSCQALGPRVKEMICLSSSLISSAFFLAISDCNASSSTEPAAKSFLNNGGFLLYSSDFLISLTALIHLPRSWPMDSISRPAENPFLIRLNALDAVASAVTGSITLIFLPFLLYCIYKKVQLECIFSCTFK